MRYVLLALLLSGCAGWYPAYQPRPGDQVTECYYAGSLGVMCYQGTQPYPVGPSNIGAFDQPPPKP